MSEEQIEQRTWVEPKFIANGQYLNFNPRQSLQDGEYTTVVKVYEEGKKITTKYGEAYMCMVASGGQKASMLLNEYLHQEFKALGPAETQFKVWVVEEKKVNPKSGIKMLVPKVFFAKSE